MNSNFDKPFTFDRVIRLTISIILLTIGIYLIYILRNVLLPFLIAWLIAYLLNPIVDFFQYKVHLKKRFLAVLLTFILLIGLLTSIVMLITPLIREEVSQINNLISTYQLQSFEINGIPLSVHDFIEEHIDFQSLRDVLSTQNATDILKYLMPTVQNVLSNSISFILGFTVIFIVILYLIFILLDYDKINKQWIEMIPPRYRNHVIKLTNDVEKSMNTYFRHQALICVIVGILFSIGFQIVGLPLAIVLGLCVGALHMIPYMHIITIAPAILLCWLKAAQTGQGFWPLVGAVLLIYIINQCIIDGILVPKIMGKAMGLNPAVILLSLSVWGSLMGVAGMIIAIPTTTLLISYYQEFINRDSTPQASIDNTSSQDKEVV